MLDLYTFILRPSNNIKGMYVLYIFMMQDVDPGLIDDHVFVKVG